jgi:Glycosyl hydrolase family 9/Cellulase N-terminal ig-like domain
MRVRVLAVASALFASITAFAATPQILTNHLGYETTGSKHAVVLGHAGDTVSKCSLQSQPDGKEVFATEAKPTGPVKKWRDWYFWTLDFDAVTIEGQYYLECASNRGTIRSYPFAIQKQLLEEDTLSDVIYYFKEERDSGQMAKADSHLAFQDGKKQGTVDAHGGWYDATGDYGKHLSHLSFSTYFNPQQIPLAVLNLFKSYDELHARHDQNFAQYERRLLDEGFWGADYLVRLKNPTGSFYRSVSAHGTPQNPEDRVIAGEMKAFGIFKTKEAGDTIVERADTDRDYETSYRSGGGIAIAALAKASTYPVSGDFKSSDYLKAAEDGFAFLEKNNLQYVNDGKENIVDDYCALTAATELYKATHKDIYKQAADRRAHNLMSRLISDGPHQNYWRADDAARPFFHASDAGFPVVSLVWYSEIADPATQKQVFETVRKSLTFELATTAEVNNPFGYAREYVQDKTGTRRTTFFFPHNSDAAPWWQGENARLASLATAARLAAPHYKEDPAFQHQLESYATNQLNWILGLNPFDSTMLNGVGRNNPRYMFFASYEFTNAPGGISNGITGGFKDEENIDYNLTYKQTGGDNDWRWGEQWIPHDAWYLLAVAVGSE